MVGVLPRPATRSAPSRSTDPAETQGVNDRAQLADAEAELRARTNRRWLLHGVTMLDPAQTYIDATVDLGRDVTLFPGTILQGRTTHRRRLRDRARHPPGRLRRSAQDAVVEHTVARQSRDRRRAPASGRSPSSSPAAGSVPGTATGAFYTGLPE